MNKFHRLILAITVLMPMSLLAQPLKGIFSIGNTGSYTSITQAITDLRTKGVDSAVVFELQADYKDSNEVFPIRIPLIAGVSAANTVTFRPASSAGMITVNGGAQSVFNFDSAQYVIIDGRAGGTGTTKNLVITNSTFPDATSPSLSRAAIRFMNHASFNQVLYDSISVDSGYAINFMSGTTIAGNDSNLIAYCAIHSYSKKAHTLIIAHNTGGLSRYNIIRGNNLFDFSPNSQKDSAFAIHILSGSTGWVIEDNSIFLTSAISNPRFTSLHGIRIIANTDFFVIRNNYIGGSAPYCGGVPLTASVVNVVNKMAFSGIILSNISSSDTTVISGNVISNIRLQAIGSTHIVGIEKRGSGLVRITGNIIGGNDDSKRIYQKITGSNSVSYFSGIYGMGQSLLVNKNFIAHVRMDSDQPISSNVFTGIKTASSNAMVIDNMIGSDAPRNIVIERSGESAGIYLETGMSLLPVEARHNLVRNIHADKSSNVSTTRIIGVYFNALSCSVDSNIIHSMSSRMTGTQPQVIGIFGQTNDSSKTFANEIYGFYNDSIKSQMQIIGISILGGATNKAHVFNNIVRDIHGNNAAATTSSDALTVTGLFITTAHCYNNQVRLGYDTSGHSVRSNTGFLGISTGTTPSITIAHNSVYIGGDSVPAFFSSAFYPRTPQSGAAILLTNNILVNNRSGDYPNKVYHHALIPAINAQSKSRSNVFYAGRSGGAIATYQDTSFIDLQKLTVALNDSGSVFGNPGFIAPDSLWNNTNLHLQGVSPAEGRGNLIAEISRDMDDEIRSSLTPVDIGADAGNFISSEAIPPTIVFTPLSNTALPGSRTLVATISDASGVLFTDSLKPLLYLKKGVFGAWQYVTGTLDSGDTYFSKWLFTVDHTMFGALVNDTVYYFVTAQDSSALRNIAGAVGSNTHHLTVFPHKPLSFRVAAAFSGVYRIGAGNPYTTLTLSNATGFFFNLSRGHVVGDITLLITADLSETGSSSLARWINEGSSKYSITIKPDTSIRRTISGATASLLTATNVENFSIDGRFDNEGRYLLLRNTSTNGRAISVLTGGKNITIRDCIIEGRSTFSTGLSMGLVNLFAGPTFDVDSVVILNNIFRKDTTGTIFPSCLFSSAGTGAIASKRVYIINNEFLNFRHIAVHADAQANATDWTIYGNKFYQTETFSAPSVNEWYASVSMYNANNIHVRKNSMGGTNANRTGARLSLPLRSLYYGIHLIGDTTVIDSNNIGNIRTDEFYGIVATGAEVSIRNNRIGYGLNPSDSIISVKQVQGINLTSTDINIQEKGEIKNNLVGNIFINGPTSGGYNYGIGLFGTEGDVSNNKVVNIRSISHGNGQMSGIVTSNGMPLPVVVNVHHNIIDSLDASGDIDVDVDGIKIEDASMGTVAYNRISRIYSSGVTGARGIVYVFSDSISIYNNQIYLPSLPAQSNRAVKGIWSDDIGNPRQNNIYNNTILISGMAIDNSYAIRVRNPQSTRIFNNILFNRSVCPSCSSAAVSLVNAPVRLPDVLGYNLMVVNDSTKAYSIAGLDYGSQHTIDINNSIGQTNTNWIERTDRLPAHLLFEDTVTGDLDIRTDNDACWYVNGKGIALADVADDIRGDARFTNIANGTTDIGADEFAPDMGVSPQQVGLRVLPGTDSAFVFAGRVIGQIQWDVNTAFPTPASSIRYYSGVPAPSLLPGADHFNAYHELTLTGGSTHSYNMWALFDSSCMGTVANKADIRMAVNQGSWTFAGGGQIYIYPLYSSDAGIKFTGSALFTGTTATNPLPVKLLTFSGIKQNKDVLLNWKTASEINTDVFVIERSYNGKTFEAIGEVKAKGNTNSTVSYQFTDKNVRPDQTIYYRLKINDYNGYSEFSKTVMITPSQAEASVSVYPNPSAANFFLHINSAQSSSTKIILYDMTGREVQTAETMLHKGSQDVEIATEHLQAGIYFVSADINGTKHTIKVIKH